ncbi:hypothetical protein M5K25_000500 [Dendrobium thyrsiflorum]|uniref:DUF4283 domain-containing protein n=1 Tax=Dendrobium thyrsiflorum TaxID=117978 RepID=A0ABD0W8G6_DENTH
MAVAHSIAISGDRITDPGSRIVLSPVFGRQNDDVRGSMVREIHLVTREPLDNPIKSFTPVICKGKQVAESIDSETLKSVKHFVHIEGEASSSSGMNLMVNRFGNVTTIPALYSEEFPLVQNNGEGTTAVCTNAQNVNTKRSEEGPRTRQEGANPWSRKPYININFENDKSILSEDGVAVRLYKPNVDSNSARLQFSVVVKVFGKDIPVQRNAMELRRQWSQFGKFQLTILGLRWVLCSFLSSEAMDGVISGGPWFINGHIVSIDKWSPKFSPSSLKGLSSPIWIRMPNLPLYCWNEINVARIASLQLDGNMFQWGRHKFTRICVRVELYKQLPLGVWVDGVEGRCGKIVHVERVCEKVKSGILSEGAKVNNSQPTSSDNVQHAVDNLMSKESTESSLYGPWVHVHNKRKKHSAIQNRVSVVLKSSIDEVASSQRNANNMDSAMQEAGFLDSAISGGSSLKAGGDVGKSLGASKESDGRRDSNFVLVGTIGGGKGLSLPIISENNMFNVFGSIEKEGEIVETNYDVPEVKKGVEGELLNSDSRGFILEEVVTGSGGREKGWGSKGIVETKITSIDKCDISNYMGKEWEFSHFLLNNCKVSIIGGDFNCILSRDDKRGGRRFKFYPGSQDMKSFMNNNDFHEVGIIGPKFTWCNNKSGGARILEWLHRCLLNTKDLSLIQHPYTRHLARVASDHCPIVMNIFQDRFHKKKILRFEDVWLSYPASLIVNFKIFTLWSKSKFQDLVRLKEKLKKDVA